jgi:hypothetical protein
LNKLFGYFLNLELLKIESNIEIQTKALNLKNVFEKKFESFGKAKPTKGSEIKICMP